MQFKHGSVMRRVGIMAAAMFVAGGLSAVVSPSAANAAPTPPLVARTSKVHTASQILAMLPANVRDGLADSDADVLGPYYILNQNSLKCLNVDNASTANLATVLQYTCGASVSNDVWWLAGSDDAYYVINDNSGKCLNIDAESKANDAKAIQFDCGSRVPNDIWVWGNTDSWGDVLNGYSGKCLNVEQAAKTDRARVLQFTCDAPARNDQWILA